MLNKSPIKLVTLSGECFQVAFQREMEHPSNLSVLYHFHVTDLVKSRGIRLVSILADLTMEVEVAD